MRLPFATRSLGRARQAISCLVQTNTTRAMKAETCASRDDDDNWDKFYGTANPRDTRIQLYLSFALGLSAFVIFCVRLTASVRPNPSYILTPSPATQAPLERPLCRAQEAEQSSHRTPGPSRQLSRLDTSTMAHHRRAGAGVGWLGCLCGT